MQVLEWSRMDMDRWVLLIYTLPASPSRKRALVWREVRRLGAVYLHDGVCGRPQTALSVPAIELLAQRIVAMDGRATVATDVRLEPREAHDLLRQMREARAAEYASIRRDTLGLLAHVGYETAHRDLGAQELAELEGDVKKLRRWLDQVAARDHGVLGVPGDVRAALGECEARLARIGAAIRSRRP